MPELLTRESSPAQLIDAVNKQAAIVEALEKQKADDARKIADLEGSLKIAEGLITEQKEALKTGLTTFTKGKFLDNPKEKVYDYMGKFYQAIFERNVKGAKRTANKKLKEMGAIPLKEKGSNELLDWEKAETFLDTSLDPNMQGKVATSSPMTGDDSDGYGHYAAYTVPPEYMTELLRIATDTSVMMGKTSEALVSGITAYFPSTDTELTFTENTNQATANTEKHVVFGQKTLTTRMFNGFVGMADMFGEDTNQDIGRMLTTMFMEAWGMRYDYEVLAHGTYGALNTGTLIHTMANTSFSSITPDDLMDMIMKFTGDKQNAKSELAQYFMDSSIWYNLAKKKDADGNYMVGNYANMPDKMAWGRPVNLTGKLPTLAETAANTKFAVLFNPRFYYVGTRRNFRFMVFENTIDRVTNNLIYFQCTTRAAFLNTQPGATVVLKTKA